MKIILEGNGFVKSILKAWSVNKESFYIPSKFNVVSDDKPFIAHNTLTRTLIEITENEKNILTGDKIQYNDDIIDLIENNFLVPESIDEITIAEQVLSCVKTFKAKTNNINLYTILTTTDCNARCFYCYEAGIEKHNMTEETAHKVVEFIRNNHGGQEVRLNWFGGEPLYNNKVMDIICNGLRVNGIKYNSKMISNGYLFDNELIKRAVEIWNLKKVQITLDGTEEIYNRVKNYIYEDDISPFKKVCDNIEQLIKNKIVVHIRLNLDEHNSENLYELVRYINERYKDKKYLYVYISLLYDLDGKKSLTEKFHLTKIKCDIDNYLNENGLCDKKLISYLPVNHCMADNDAATLINPLGDLAKCEHYVYGDETYGSIYNPDVINENNILSWKKIRPKTKVCNDCKIYPMCYILERCIQGINDCDEADRFLYENNIKKHMRYEWRNALENNTL